jgi:hypothetical protein
MNVRIVDRRSLADFVSFCAIDAVVYSILFTAATKSGEKKELNTFFTVDVEFFTFSFAIGDE